MKIGELAHVAQCTVETVRYYEKEGLLPEPARTAGNFRIYGPAHLERLRFIRNCRALDMSHDEIHTLLNLADHPADGCGAVNAVFDQHIAHVEERLQELTQLKQQLTGLRQRCSGEQATDDCGILQGLATMEAEPRAARQTHLPQLHQARPPQSGGQTTFEQNATFLSRIEFNSCVGLW